MILNGFKIFLILILITFFRGKVAPCQTFQAAGDSVSFKTEEIKVISNRILSEDFRTFSKIRFIGEEQIRNMNGDRLSDILSYSGGVFVKSYGGNSSLSTVSISGSGSEHTLILLDGFKLNSTQNNQVDLSTISKDNIENIEIMNSGSGSAYGSQAMSGVINIVTKKNSTDKLGLVINGQSGSYGFRKYFAGISKNISGFESYFNYSAESSDNSYEYRYFNGKFNELKHRINSSYDLSNYSLNLAYRRIRNSILNIYSNYSVNNRNLPGPETGSAPSDSRQADKNLNSIVSLHTDLSSKLSLNTRFNYQNNLSEYSDDLLTDSYYKNITYAVSAGADHNSENIRLSGGYEFIYSSLKSNEITDDALRIQNSLYLVTEIDLNKMFKVFPSVRIDNFSDIGKTIVTGKFGMNIRPLPDEEMYLKFGAGNNYSSPTFNELYWKDLGNINLNPERSFNIDAGIVYKFDLITENKIELTYNHIDYKDKIIWQPGSGGLWSPVNTSSSVSNVFLADLYVRRTFSGIFSADFNLNYTYTNALNRNSGNPDFLDKQLIYIPADMIRSSITLNYGNSGVSFYYNFTGKRYTDQYNSGYLPAYDIFNGNVFYSPLIIGLKSTFKIELNNITNKNYQIVSGYPMPLRNFKISVNLEY
ncbi:MAG: TonB-dependent receptor [Bacteroidetes bacterium]|nr:TonB-dependent receptor [Bacteroidota bacterium]